MLSRRHLIAATALATPALKEALPPSQWYDSKLFVSA